MTFTDRFFKEVKDILDENVAMVRSFGYDEEEWKFRDDL